MAPTFKSRFRSTLAPTPVASVGTALADSARTTSRGVIVLVVGSLLLGTVCMIARSAAAIPLLILEYQGPFYESIDDMSPPDGQFTTDMRITGSFAVSGEAFPVEENLYIESTDVLSYSFFDGRRIYTEANSTITEFRLLKEEGDFVREWAIEISANLAPPETAHIRTATAFSLPRIDIAIYEDAFYGTWDQAWAVYSTGRWEATRVIPEPSTLSLVIVGVAAIAVARRRKLR